MKDFCVVGSGISGSTIANLLAKKYSVEIFDKARGPGGRASSRRYKNNLSFDHGLQYFSPKSNLFKKFILSLKKKRILKEWDGYHLDYTFKKKRNSIKYIGTRGNNDICKYLIKSIKVNYNSAVTSIKFNSRYWTITINNTKKVFFKCLILTCPYAQSKTLASNYIKKISNLNIKMSPNITIMAAYKKYKELPINNVKFNDEIIAWAAQENTKGRFKAQQILWTIQCTDFFSKKIINSYKKNKNKYLFRILKRFEHLTGYQVKNAVFKNMHGWKYAYNKSDITTTSLWRNQDGIGVCADWLNGPRAEDAWLSASSIYRSIKKNPPVKRRV
ncbi:NAD(P)-binding protein [Pelagibacteraceae bacterium]|nr:NAD(P)-binding protein [Pelagibacteraceae bacterium]